MSSRSFPMLAVLLTSLAFVSPSLGVGPREEQAEERFTPPVDADAETLLNYIAKLAEPGIDFQSREAAGAYSRRAATAIATAAETVLAGEATDQQTIKAIELKASALRLLEGLNAARDQPSVDEFLAKLQNDKRPAVALAALNHRIADRVQHWRALGSEEKEHLYRDVKSVIKATPATPSHARLLTFMADVLGDTPDRQEVLALVEKMIPHLKASKAAGMNEKLSALNGVVRRLRLPGKPIAVEGALLNGEPIDWEAYRGKVVLIDYWATWCGLCHAELPTIRKLHKTYADQGFEVLGVSLDDDQQRVVQFLDEHAIPWPTLFGSNKASRGWNHPMVSKYGIHDLPRVILVDREGRVVTMNARGGQLAAEVRKLFADTAADKPAGHKSSDADLVADASDR